MSGLPSDRVPGALCPGARCVLGGKEAHAWFTSESTCIASARTSRSSTSTVGSCSRAGSSTIPERFRELFGELGEEARFALEATYGWEWLAELLEHDGRELHLAHPLRT